jgi:hypothetical protein
VIGRQQLTNYSTLSVILFTLVRRHICLLRSVLFFHFKYCFVSTDRSLLPHLHVHRYLFVPHFLCFVVITLLDDLFFCILLYTFVRGFSDIFFGFACFLFVIFLVTVVFAGLFAVKCCHIGLLFSFASSFTRFMLWSMTDLHLCSHFFSC